MVGNYRGLNFERHIRNIGFSPLDVMLTGSTGSGKSTTINCIFDKPIAKVGDGAEPETMSLNAFRLTDHMRFWDTPGLGDGIRNDLSHAYNIKRLLRKPHHGQFYLIDMVIVIVDAGSRDIGTTVKLIDQVLTKSIPPERIMVALNQADFAMKGRHWDSTHNIPDDVLHNFLEDKAESVQRRINDSAQLNLRKPVYYSAKYRYHIEALYDAIIAQMPDKPRRIANEPSCYCTHRKFCI